MIASMPPALTLPTKVPFRWKSKVAPSCGPSTTTHLPVNSDGSRFPKAYSESAQVVPADRAVTRARTSGHFQARVAVGRGGAAGGRRRLLGLAFMVLRAPQRGERPRGGGRRGAR